MPTNDPNKANELRSQALADLTALMQGQNREGLEASASLNGDEHDTGAGDAGVHEHGNPEGQGDAGESHIESDAQGEQKPPEQKKEKRDKSLQEKFEILDRNFRALQASVTPLQQERARLREQVRALETELATLRPKEGDSYEKLKDAARRASEVVPEAGEALELLAEENRKRDEREAGAARAREAEALARFEAHKRTVMGEITNAHPDARAIAGDDTFWNFVDSFGVPQYREILDEPWEYEEGPAIVAELFSAFKKATGKPQERVPRPGEVKRPSAISSSSKSDGAVPATGGSGKAVWTEKDLEAKTQSLNRLHGKAALDASKEILGQMSLLAQAGTRTR